MPGADWQASSHPSYDGDGIVDLLRLFGAGVIGSILALLSERPHRTNELADRVPGFSPRTVYRHVGRLVELGAVERREQPGVPSHVEYSLTGSGFELHALAQAFAKASLEVRPDGVVVPHSWRLMTLLADLWESTMFVRLGLAPSTATQLARVSQDLSFHQVRRRISLMIEEDLLREVFSPVRRRHYELTGAARRGTALIVALGQWRERHLLKRGEPGLSTVEVREVLKAALSVAAVPGRGRKSVALSVAEAGRDSWKDGEVIWATVEPNGSVDCNAAPRAGVDAWAFAGVDRWTEALLTGKGTGIRAGGSTQLTRAVLRRMHEALWAPRDPEAAADGWSTR